jgi:hypothetical protein
MPVETALALALEAALKETQDTPEAANESG